MNDNKPMPASDTTTPLTEEIDNFREWCRYRRDNSPIARTGLALLDELAAAKGEAEGLREVVDAIKVWIGVTIQDRAMATRAVAAIDNALAEVTTASPPPAQGGADGAGEEEDRHL